MRHTLMTMACSALSQNTIINSLKLRDTTTERPYTGASQEHMQSGENMVGKAIQWPSHWSESGKQLNTAHDKTLPATAPRQRGPTATDAC